MGTRERIEKAIAGIKPPMQRAVVKKTIAPRSRSESRAKETEEQRARKILDRARDIIYDRKKSK